MNRVSIVWVILASFGLGYLLNDNWCCTTSSLAPSSMDTVTTVIYDTINVEAGINAEHIQVVEVSKTNHLVEIDTAEILNNYIHRHEYLSNYQDSSINLELRPIVQFGELDSIGVKYQIIQPIQSRLITREHPKRWCFYGGLSSTWTPHSTTLAPMLQVKYRNDYSFGVGYSPWPHGGSVTLNATFKLFDIP